MSSDAFDDVLVVFNRKAHIFLGAWRYTLTGVFHKVGFDVNVAKHRYDDIEVQNFVKSVRYHLHHFNVVGFLCKLLLGHSGKLLIVFDFALCFALTKNSFTTHHPTPVFRIKPQTPSCTCTLHITILES